MSAPARSLQFAIPQSVFGVTYPLVHVDGVLASDNVRNGGTLSLAGRLLSLGSRHGWMKLSVSISGCVTMQKALRVYRDLRQHEKGAVMVGRKEFGVAAYLLSAVRFGVEGGVECEYRNSTKSLCVGQARNSVGGL